VITLLWWLPLQSIITLVGAQLNVVLKARLHPRGLVDVAATDADYRAYQACAQERSYHDQEQVYADFPPPATVVRSPVVEPRSGAAGAGHAVPTALSHRRAHSPRTICLAGRYRAARGGPARRYGWWTRVTALL
jgi:hypothetical protein